MKITIGNLFDSQAKTLVNTVNCVGYMGKGIALDFKKRYPDMFNEYKYLCSIGNVRPGVPYFYQDIEGNSILLFPTKDDWRSPSQLRYIESGLEWFREHYAENGVLSIAFPPLGCGNGGLEWDTVGPLMYQKLNDLPIDITIFAPYGTPTAKLSESYLRSRVPDEFENIVGGRSTKINPYWYLIPYMVQRLNNDRYSLSVGRTILQKICYVLTRAGVPTEFRIARNSYGPFSTEVKSALASLINANILSEERAGQMVMIKVADGFALDETRYSEQIMFLVDSAFDLLSRVKNTEHAEMLTTVLFAFDALEDKIGAAPTEKQIVEYVEKWKPHWIEEKHDVIISTIKGLAELDWIKPDWSCDVFPEEELI